MRDEEASNSPRARRIHVIADDLTGAVEVAALLAPGAGDALVTLVGPASGPDHDQSGARNAHDRHADVQALDLDLRHAPPEQAYAAVKRALGSTIWGTGFVKLDSMLRGSPATMVAAAAATGPVVVCPALPAAGRATIGGRLRVRAGSAGRDGARLSEPVRPYEATLLDLEAVRGQRLRSVVEEAVTAGRVPICDAESDADLDAVVDAATTIPGIRFVGSGGLAAALGRRVGGHRSPAHDRRSLTTSAPVLAVVGTTAGSAHTQTDRLAAAHQGRAVELRPDAPRAAELNRVVRAVTEGLDDAPVVLGVDRTEPARSSAAEIAILLGDLVRTTVRLRPRTRLFLTGGHTARSVLDALGVRTLTPVTQIGTGAVHCRTDTGRDVVTRPGSLGPDDALVDAADYLAGR